MVPFMRHSCTLFVLETTCIHIRPMRCVAATRDCMYPFGVCMSCRWRERGRERKSTNKFRKSYLYKQICWVVQWHCVYINSSLGLNVGMHFYVVFAPMQCCCRCRYNSTVHFGWCEWIKWIFVVSIKKKKLTKRTHTNNNNNRITVFCLFTMTCS